MQSASKPVSTLLPGAAGAVEPRAKREIVSDSIATGLIFALVLTLGQRVIGFGRGILFCRFMTDQELGQWSMIWSYLMLLAPLAVLGLPGCFGKYSEFYRQRGQLKTFIQRIVGISLAMTGLLSLTIFFLPETFAWFLFRDTDQVALVRWIAVALFFVSANNFLSSLMESLRQVRAATIMRFVTSVVFAGVAILLLATTSLGSGAATIGFAGGCLLGAVPAVWVLWHYRESIADRGDMLTHRAMWKRIAPFAVWLWVSNLLNNLFEVSDRYMLIHWSNTTADLAQGAVGQYHSGRVVPLLLVSIAIMLAGLLLPYMSEAWEAGNKKKAQRQLSWSIKLISLLFTGAGVFILLASPLLFDWVLEGRYSDGLAILPLTLVYCIWFSLHAIGQDYLWVAEKGKWATLATGAGLLVNIGLNVILIPRLGLTGAVMATAGGNFAIVLLMFGLNYRFGCRHDWGIWLSAVLPLLLLLGVGAAALAMLVVMAACLWTEWVFSNSEKREIWAVAQAKLPARFRR